MILIFIYLLSILNLQAKSENELGLSFSSLSGAGINYNRELNSKFNLELNSFYFYLGNNPPKVYDTYFNIGGEFQYNIFKNSYNRFYSFIGLSYWNINQNYVIQIPVVNGSPKEESKIKSHSILNYGFGVGNEFRVLNDFSLSFSILYQFQNLKNSSLNNFLDRNPKKDFYQGFGFGVSFRYKF